MLNLQKNAYFTSINYHELSKVINIHISATIKKKT